MKLSHLLRHLADLLRFFSLLIRPHLQDWLATFGSVGPDLVDEVVGRGVLQKQGRDHPVLERTLEDQVVVGNSLKSRHRDEDESKEREKRVRVGKGQKDARISNKQTP